MNTQDPVVMTMSSGNSSGGTLGSVMPNSLRDAVEGDSSTKKPSAAVASMEAPKAGPPPGAKKTKKSPPKVADPQITNPESPASGGEVQVSGPEGVQDVVHPRSETQETRGSTRNATVFVPKGVAPTLQGVLGLLCLKLVGEYRHLDIRNMPVDWRGRMSDPPQDDYYLFGFHNAQDSFPLEFHDADGRDVGPMLALAERVEDPSAQKICLEVAEFAKLFGAGDPPEMVPAKWALLFGGWQIVSKIHPGEWLWELFPYFRTWFKDRSEELNYERLLREVAGLVQEHEVKGRAMGGEGRGFVHEGRSTDMFRKAALDPTKTGTLFFLDTASCRDDEYTEEEGSLGTLIIGTGTSAHHVMSAWSQMLGEAGEMSCWRQLEPRDGDSWMVIRPVRGHRTNLKAAEVLLRLSPLVVQMERFARATLRRRRKEEAAQVADSKNG